MRTITIFLTFFALHAMHNALAQTGEQVDDEVKLDILQTPTSPAGNLLGISDAQIENPTDPTEFMIMVSQATNDFTALPNQFAIDVAPAWLLAGHKITMEQFIEDKLWNNVKQSLVFSAATRSADSLGNMNSTENDMTRVAAGLKMSLFRGTVDSRAMSKLDELRRERGQLLKAYSTGLDSLLQTDSTFVQLKRQRIEILRSDMDFATKQVLLSQIDRSLEDLESRAMEKMENTFEQLKTIAEQVQFTRYGFKMDLAAGCAFDFPMQTFQEGYISQIGVWSTFGWKWKQGFSAMAMARYLYHPDAVYFSEEEVELVSEDVPAFDAGARFTYDVGDRKFSLSGEILYRSITGVEDLDDNWRVALNAAYDLGSNKKVTFLLGKDFNSFGGDDGNLIANVNLLVGLGGSKNL